MAARTLYASRPLLNGTEVQDWFRQQGWPCFIAPAKMHVTLVYSKRAIEWPEARGDMIVCEGGERAFHHLGEPGRGGIVQRFDSAELEKRWGELLSAGASWDYAEYIPHTTLVYADGAELEMLVAMAKHFMPFPGPLHFGPERFAEINENWNDEVAAKAMSEHSERLEKAFMISMPAIVKARPLTSDGRRPVSIEASNDIVDTDGDIILQKALMDGADRFVSEGHLDLEHRSEMGVAVKGLPPEMWIVGRPRHVRGEQDAGVNRTIVEGEIRRNMDGSVEPAKYPWDAFWASLQTEPPVQWRASIFGYASDIVVCTGGAGKPMECGPATNSVVKGMIWKSLAFTRNPANQAIKGHAHIMTAKAWMEENEERLLKGPPGALGSMTHHYELGRACGTCGLALKAMPTLGGWRAHFEKCAGLDPESADVLSHAMMFKGMLGGIGYPGGAGGSANLPSMASPDAGKQGGEMAGLPGFGGYSPGPF